MINKYKIFVGNLERRPRHIWEDIFIRIMKKQSGRV
jgi:hypothetical protein